MSASQGRLDREPQTGRLKQNSFSQGFGGWSSKGFPGGSAGKEPACHAGDLGSIPGLGRSPGEGNGYPPQYTGLEKSLDCIVSPWGRKESDTTERLSLSLPSKIRGEVGLVPPKASPSGLSMAVFVVVSSSH